MVRQPGRRSLASALAGRTFVHPSFDYLVIGGGFSLVVTALLPSGGDLSFATLRFGGETVSLWPAIILLCSSAHLASSTVRLYTKPGGDRVWPFLTRVFPLVALLLLTLSILESEVLGRHVLALFLTWSPYHYSAQAYGLAVMYSYRSGCEISPRVKSWLWWVCLLPFLHALAQSQDAGIGWLLPAGWLEQPVAAVPLAFAARALEVLMMAAPVALFAWVWRSASGPMPAISLLVMLSNAVWWVVLSYKDAFVLSTIFHGIQYLGIVTIFHVRDQLARAENQRGALYHVLSFYGASALLGYALLSCLPQAYVLAGFGMVESLVLVSAAINIHHFIVDAFIWRLGKGGDNRRIVDQGVAPA